MELTHRIRRSPRAVLALLLLALATGWVQSAYHQPMALAAATDPLLAGVVCGGPLSAADVAQLVDIGILPPGSDGHENALCDLLTLPAAMAVVVPVIPADSSPAAMPLPVPAAAPALAQQTRLPPPCGPPALA